MQDAGRRVTVVVPCLNQGRFLAQALDSILEQQVTAEIIVMDGGSTDNTLEVIARYEPHLAHWQSGRDGGQAAAINGGLQRATAPFCAWLNSDDMYLPGALNALVDALENAPQAPAAYGRVDNLDDVSGRRFPVRVEPWDMRRLSLRCIISQPGSLMRRSALEAVGWVNPDLSMAMDYDLWWRLGKRFGPLVFTDTLVAINRLHRETKTQSFRRRHYREAIAVVRRHYGSVPLKWWLYQPYAVWWKALSRRGG